VETETFRKKLQNGGALGMFSKTSDPGFVETLGFAGWDFVILDLEHGPNSVQTLQNVIRAAQVSGIFPIARVKESCASVAAEALDVGAGGVQFPQISSKAAAADALRRVKFAPEGARGVCRFVRAANYSAKDRFEYFAEANRSIVVLQVEGQAGIDALDEILTVPGIDVLFVGPYDLSQSLGVPGQIGHPMVEEKMLEIVEKCAGREIAVGTFTDTLENARKWQGRGVKYIAHSVDMGVFYEAAASLLQQLKEENV
jgi:4-hydroxy-2-oxoheptanedioate aldolase